MNGRKLYREYAKSKGVDCAEFVNLEEDYYGAYLHYKNSEGSLKKIILCRKQMVEWIIKSFNNKMWEGYKL